MKLTKNQKKLLKTIENPKQREQQRIQFKLQNKFDTFFEQHPDNGVIFTFKEGFTDFEKGIETVINKIPQRFRYPKFKGKIVWEEDQNSLTKEKLFDLTNPSMFFTTIDKINMEREVKEKLFDLNSPENSKVPKYSQKLHDLGYRPIENKKTITTESYSDLHNLNYCPQKNENSIPNEFCVKITEENKEVLDKLFFEKHTVRWGLRVSDFLHSNNKYSFLYSCNKPPNKTENVKIVSTEEFLRYIGKEELIEKPKAKFSKYPELTSGKIIMVNGENYLVRGVGLVLNSVVSVSLEKTDSSKTVEPKPLDFDLPKKENPIQDIECLSINEVIYSGVLMLDSPLCKNLKNYLIDIVGKKTNPLNL